MQKCPNCNTEGVYIGLSVVECSNVNCQYFKASIQVEAKLKDSFSENLAKNQTVFTQPQFYSPFQNWTLPIGFVRYLFHKNAGKAFAPGLLNTVSGSKPLGYCVPVQVYYDDGIDM